MKRIGLADIACLALLLQSGAARAAGDCGFDPAQITYSPDRSAISLPFDVFEAEPGNGVRCELSIPTQRPGGSDTFSVYVADYRGFVNEGDAVRLTVEQAGSSEGATVDGPADGLLLRGYVGTFGRGTIDSTVRLDLAQAGDPFTFASLDTIDYALAATTTAGELTGSIDALGAARTGVLVRLQSVAGLLTGIDRPPERPAAVTLLGAAGSYLAGVAAHVSPGEGLWLDGGLALIEQSGDGARARGVMAAATLRMVEPGTAGWRTFAETGLRAAPLRLRFGRDYADGTEGGARGTGSASGVAAGVHGSVGLLLEPGKANQLVLSATLAQDWLAVGGYAEAFGDRNLFAASFGSETTGLTVLKLGAAWTTALTPALEVTLNAGAGHGWAGGRLRADLSFAGAFEGGAQDDDFLEYGARFGFRPFPTLRADLFAQGTAGRSSDSQVFWGASLGHQF